MSKKYIVAYEIKGRVYIPVKKEPVPNMLSNADTAIQDMEFGDLQDIQWDTIHIETPDGQYIDPHVTPYPDIKRDEDTLDGYFALLEETHPDMDDEQVHARIKQLLMQEEQISNQQADVILNATQKQAMEIFFKEENYYSDFEFYLNQHIDFLHKWNSVSIMASQ